VDGSSKYQQGITSYDLLDEHEADTAGGSDKVVHLIDPSTNYTGYHLSICFTVIATSPNMTHYHEMTKEAKPELYYPIWNQKEIEKMNDNQPESEKLKKEDLLERYKYYGGESLVALKRGSSN